MRNDDEGFEMPHAPAGSRAASAEAATLSWHTPVRFDPDLVRKLRAEHDALDAHVAALPARFARDRDEALKAAQACAGRLHALRRQEALWIYPVMARSFAHDAASRGRLLNLRFVMNGLARRVLRGIDDLVRAMRNARDIPAAAGAVSRALAEYRHRNESELYTLYSLTGPLHSRAAVPAR